MSFSLNQIEKCSIASLTHQRILCSEWVPSEWESKQLIKTFSPSINVSWSEKLWLIFMFLSVSKTDGTHSVQSIHWWASNVMLFLQIWKSWMSWGWVNSANFYFGVFNTFKTKAKQCFSLLQSVLLRCIFIISPCLFFFFTVVDVHFSFSLGHSKGVHKVIGTWNTEETLACTLGRGGGGGFGVQRGLYISRRYCICFQKAVPGE